jgi:LPXTG-motif cell wall-anchored protein
MANGRTGGSRTIWYIVGGIILLLILAWLFGLFGGGEVAEVGDDAAATGEAVEEAAEDAGEPAGDAAEEAGDAVEDAAD